MSNEVMERECWALLARPTPVGTMKVRESEEHAFRLGWKTALAHAKAQDAKPAPFDGQAVWYALGYDSEKEPAVKHIVAGARWQHEQDQAALAAERERSQKLVDALKFYASLRFNRESMQWEEVQSGQNGPDKARNALAEYEQGSKP